MIKKLFVSDFDGTITKKDFFLLYMDKFLGARGREFLADYRAENNPSYQFLNQVFAMQKISWADYQALLKDIQWDAYFPQFLTDLAARQIDHVILSAGIDFYIRDALDLKGLPKQRIIANSGYFDQGQIKLTHDTNSPIFSPLYGVDKGKAIDQLRQEYDYIFFAGDSLPDISAAEQADRVFAKASLADHYQMAPADKIRAFNNYQDISRYLRDEYLPLTTAGPS